MALAQDSDRHSVRSRVLRAAAHFAVEAIGRLRPYLHFVPVALLALTTAIAFLAPQVLPAALLAATGVALGCVIGQRGAPDASEPDGRQRELIEARRRAEEASHAKSRFLAMVSHEVRTPLNGILGMTHLLERTELSAEQESYVAAVRRSGKALFDLVSDLLDFSTIEAGRFDLRTESGDLPRLIEEAVELMAPRAHEKGLDIAAMIDPRTPVTVAADHSRLRQVLFNLLGNAIKFTDKGGVSLSVAPISGGVVLAIADTGPGLAEDDRERIFQEFEQADKGSTRSHGGVGLGLAISSRIVAAMGGRIELDTIRGQGSRFMVHLPITAETAELPKDEPLDDHRVLLMVADGPTADSLASTIGSASGATLRWNADKDGELAAFCRREAITELICNRTTSEAAAEALAAIPGHDAGGPRRILLVRPAEREALETRKERGFDAWLVSPVRRASLSAVLRGIFGDNGERQHPDRDRLRQQHAASRPFNILLAEDNPVNALLVTHLLRKEGHSVTHLEDGRGVLAALVDSERQGWHFDMVITDLAMPHVDGIAALKQIRRQQLALDLPHIPVVVLSADGEDDTRRRAMEIGADLYLEKPIDPLALIDVVARAA